jgi:hypothetical protein
VGIRWSDEQIAAAKIDPKRLARLVKKLKECSREMWDMDLYIYGASGYGNLMHRSRPPHRDEPGGRLVADHDSPVAKIGEGFDGGDW